MAFEYNIRYSKEAAADLEEIAAYYFEELEMPMAAKELMRRMYKAIDQLGSFPEIGTSFDDLYLSKMGFRRLFVKEYVIVYIIDREEKNVNIFRVFNGRTDYPTLLNDSLPQGS